MPDVPPDAGPSPDGNSGGNFLASVASRVPWFDAGPVLIIVIYWIAVLSNLSSAKFDVQVLLIAVGFILTVLVGWEMRQRFRLVARRGDSSPVISAGESVLSRTTRQLPTPTSYGEELKELPERKPKRRGRRSQAKQ